MLEQARKLYAQNKLSQAVQLYSQISAESDFWLEAIEERAWSFTREGQYEMALADLLSITSPVLSPQIGPETYILSALVSLKVCNYKDVASKIQLFKKRMLPRVSNLEQITSESLPTSFLKLIPQITNESLTATVLGHTADLYPRYFFRDQQLISNLKNKDFNLAAVRLNLLAKEDLKDIEVNLKKIKLIEVELIQNVILSERNQSNLKNLKFSKTDSKNTIVFPVTNDEVWLDEVGQFQVRSQACLNKKGRTL